MDLALGNDLTAYDRGKRTVARIFGENRRELHGRAARLQNLLGETLRLLFGQRFDGESRESRPGKGEARRLGLDVVKPVGPRHNQQFHPLGMGGGVAEKHGKVVPVVSIVDDKKLSSLTKVFQGSRSDLWRRQGHTDCHSGMHGRKLLEDFLEQA